MAKKINHKTYLLSQSLMLEYFRQREIKLIQDKAVRDQEKIVHSLRQNIISLLSSGETPEPGQMMASLQEGRKYPSWKEAAIDEIHRLGGNAESWMARVIAETPVNIELVVKPQI